MTIQPLVFSSSRDGVLVAPPHCGLLAVPDFLGQVRRWSTTAGRTFLVVDLSPVTTMEAAAFRALMWARRHCLSRGISFGIVPPAAGVLKPYEDAILNDLFSAQVELPGPFEPRSTSPVPA
jgi:hypothetical protein